MSDTPYSDHANQPVDVKPFSAGDRVGILGADRPCTSCAYDLIGQPIVRDPVYQLLLVRCPECGTATALQEYPLLGRWAGRWAMVLAASWMLALVVLLLLSGLAMAGLSMWFGEAMAEPLRGAARADYMAWWEERQIQAQMQAAAAAAAEAGGEDDGGSTAAAQPAPPAPIAIWQQRASEQKASVEAWWSHHGGLEGWIAGRQGWLRALDWWGLGALAVSIPAAAAIGAVWAVAVLGLPRRRLWGVGLVVAAVGAAFCLWFLMLAEQSSAANRAAFSGWHFTVGRFADWRVQYPATVLSLLLLIAGVFVGLHIGRPVARLLVRTLLPPRMRWGLAMLWTTEGLKPPSVR